ncbi:hypothetical protein [Ruminococcus albus]|uniref:DUF3592 domain-containing protein n=1 Tax=Ruminococcus albus (strain ATCC 27210 / DSM 20455 / JCM 14654 / NCDO 2250 / 7) TaxID=697329 RepID=E6UDI4_RUMA7|nr:hypothetical protein [Ruminococcus albus]ADU22867.1 hypothetical protein Rumal_2387 [Ruminococcus albus 7 = DSM 20455]
MKQKVFLIISLLIMFTGIFISTFGANNREKQIRKCTVETDATVTKVQGPNDDGESEITAYFMAGTKYIIRFSTYGSMETGETFSIKYDPNDPMNYVISGLTDDNIPEKAHGYLLTKMGLILSVISVILYIASLRRSEKQCDIMVKQTLPSDKHEDW